jgi:hypothetical protein
VANWQRLGEKRISEMAIPTEEFLKHQQQRLFNALIEIEEG